MSRATRRGFTVAHVRDGTRASQAGVVEVGGAVRLNPCMRTVATAAILTASIAALAACSEGSPDPAPATSAASPSPTASSTDEAAAASAAPEPGVYAIECDPAGHVRTDAVTILGPDDYRVGGWNHINGVGSFSGALLEPRDYAISAENYVEQPDCGGQRALETVMVKKTYDWDRQHANGIEATFPAEQLTFGSFTDIVLEVRVDGESTAIPSADDLAATYGDLLDPDQLSALDAQQINLELTLFGDGADAGAQTMNAGTIVSIDPDESAGGWVRVAVPRDDLSFYTETDYVRTDLAPDEHGALQIDGLRINPETAEGATVRRLQTEAGDEFEVTAAPETLKEMGLTFALIQVGHDA